MIQGERAIDRETLAIKGHHVNPAFVQGQPTSLTWGDLALFLNGRRWSDTTDWTEREVSSGRSSDGPRGTWTAPVVKGQTERRARHS